MCYQKEMGDGTASKDGCIGDVRRSIDSCIDPAKDCEIMIGLTQDERLTNCLAITRLTTGYSFTKSFGPVSLRGQCEKAQKKP